MRLHTKYLGFDLDNPLVPSASPLTRDVSMVKQLEDAGAPAVVMYSLFEEEIHHEDAELDHYMSSGSESFAEALSYFPEPKEVAAGAEEYLLQIQKLKSAVDIPVIASLNGVSTSGWIEYARKIQEAGADALELNIFMMPTGPEMNGAQIKNVYIESLKAVKKACTLPIAMKIGPYFSALPAFAGHLQDTGADALVMFNRFYQPDIDLENLVVSSEINLSTSDNIRLPLRWIAVLRDQIKIDLAATSGVHNAKDVLKLTMAGADVTMMAAALLKKGPNVIRKIQKKLIEWMDENEYESLDQMRGSMSMKNVNDTGVFMRGNYIKMLREFRVQI